jgi:hypothetical protein
MKKLVLMFLLFAGLLYSDEGMYPISEIHKLNLKAKGLKIDVKDLYNPNGISLIDAIVNVGGCTGSFVSNDGLILTNHHCAFGAVQAASSKDHDYVTDGFLARTRGEEIVARGLTVRITESYRDVSKEVLSAIADTMDLAGRARAIDRKMKEIVAEAEKKNPGKRAEVSEMFAGKTYVLFLYTNLRDVRLVYVPPRSVGEFGGENDNWVWPRHTGDFSFVRVYSAPDGSPADYSPNNVPFKPKRFLKVNPAGVDDGDFVFILGYPGRTFRHNTSHYLAYEEQYRMPYIANLYEWQMAVMEQFGEKDRGVAIKHDARIKSLANVMKNYRGKLKGMERLKLLVQKQEDEKGLQIFINADPTRRVVYGNVLEEIGKVYQEMTGRVESELILNNLRQSSILLNAAYVISEAAGERRKPDLERIAPYMDRNFNTTKQNLRSALANYYEPTDKTFLNELLLQAAKLPEDQRIPAVDAILKSGDAERDIDQFIERLFSGTTLADADVVMAALDESAEDIGRMNDPFIEFARALAPTFRQLRETTQRRDGALSRLSALLVDVKAQYLKTNFIPDANRTLRLTFGYIRGYSPADATYHNPITTLRGVIEKTTGVEPFITPQKIIDLHKAKDFGRFKSTKLNDVAVALLYNTDTTGGNSGSPVINGRGELIGVNFDRPFEATINDYAWSESYSRSIAVDIRYVLWVTQKFAGATWLLDEMGVK